MSSRGEGRARRRSAAAVSAAVSAAGLSTLLACVGPADAPTFTDEETQAGLGDLEVSTVTRGSNFDPDGYTVFIDEGNSETLPPNGSTRFEDLAAGPWNVSITGVASNCTLAGSATQTVTVLANSTVSIAFLVDCA